MTSPEKSAHIADQGIAAYRTFGAAYAAMYEELTDRGVAPEHATAMIRERIRADAAATVAGQVVRELTPVLRGWG